MKTACRFLAEYRIHALPVNPFAIIRASRWGLVTYRALAGKTGVGVGDIIDACRSPDGYTIFNGNNYCISYNGDAEPFSRIRFTLLHEIGHIYLSHFIDYAPQCLEMADFPALEEEANRFACEVMAPAAVIRGCGWNSPEQLERACFMSHSAAKLRLIQIKNRRFSEEDEKVAELFEEYIRLHAVREKAQRRRTITYSRCPEGKPVAGGCDSR